MFLNEMFRNDSSCRFFILILLYCLLLRFLKTKNLKFKKIKRNN